MIIAIDFDGTCVTHDFPNVGKEIGAAPVLKRLVEAGHKLILYTMRSDLESPSQKPQDDDTISGGQQGMFLSDAVNWFKGHGIELYGIQKNPDQHLWTTSNKCYAHIYIDDAALGAPVILDTTFHQRPYIDWEKVEEIISRY